MSELKTKDEELTDEELEHKMKGLKIKEEEVKIKDEKVEIKDNEKSNAKDIFFALKEDTEKVSVIDVNSLYSVQLNSGGELISVKSFTEMGLKPKLLESIYKLKIEKPSMIQNLAIPHIMAGRDLAFHSTSGTGKTIAFALGALNVAEPKNGPQVIILTPTRELCAQVGKVLEQHGVSVGISVCLALSNFVSSTIPEEIVIGTPAKIVKLLKDEILDKKNIKMIIFDEADVLISERSFGFCTNIILKTFEKTQKVFFSATYSDFSRLALNRFAPKTDTFFQKNLKADKIQLYHIEMEPSSKIDALESIFSLLTIAQTIIFVGRRHTADMLFNKLKRDKFSVSCIHGEVEPADRDSARDDFAAALTKILVTTDVFARGMDIPQVNLVINYDMPYKDKNKDRNDDNFKETYIHRVGRAGRFNRSGFVIDFIASKEDLSILNEIQAYTNSVSKKITIQALEEILDEEDVLKFK